MYPTKDYILEDSVCMSVICEFQPASEECRPGGCACGVDVVVRQSDGRGCQGVDVGRHKGGRGIGEPNVCVTLVVGQAANKS